MGSMTGKNLLKERAIQIQREIAAQQTTSLSQSKNKGKPIEDLDEFEGQSKYRYNKKNVGVGYLPASALASSP